MVILFHRATSLCVAFLLAQRPRTAEQFLKTQDGVKALAGLAALVILGFGMVFLTYLGGRITRRYMNPTFRTPPPNPDPEDWATPPIVDRSDRKKRKK